MTMRIPLTAAAVVFAVVVVCLLPPSVIAQTDDETTAWSAVKDSQSSLEVRGFMRAFPRGKFFEGARQKYIQLARGIFPAETLDLHVNYPIEARSLPFSVGSRSVELDVVVEASGKAGAIRITKQSGFDPIDRAAVGAARRAIYLPAVEDGMAVSSHLPLKIDFILRCPGDYNLVSCKDGEFR
jgi:TonB family protein